MFARCGCGVVIAGGIQARPQQRDARIGHAGSQYGAGRELGPSAVQGDGAILRQRAPQRLIDAQSRCVTLDRHAQIRCGYERFDDFDGFDRAERAGEIPVRIQFARIHFAEVIVIDETDQCVRVQQVAIGDRQGVARGRRELHRGGVIVVRVETVCVAFQHQRAQGGGSLFVPDWFECALLVKLGNQITRRDVRAVGRHIVARAQLLDARAQRLGDRVGRGEYRQRPGHQQCKERRCGGETQPFTRKRRGFAARARLVHYHSGLDHRSNYSVTV